MKTEVYKTGPSRFDMCGQSLPPYLGLTEQKISAGLVDRLHKYALQQMNDSGFQTANTEITVYTLDGDEGPSDRQYNVDFKNAKGGVITVCGIMTKSGWPFLHFGFNIESN